MFQLLYPPHTSSRSTNGVPLMYTIGSSRMLIQSACTCLVAMELLDPATDLKCGACNAGRGQRASKRLVARETLDPTSFLATNWSLASVCKSDVWAAREGAGAE